jgi:hypothetical protein
MYRVVRPGGVVALATEFRLAGPPPGLPGTVLFDESELRQVLLEGLDWELPSPLELSISDETMAAPVDFDSLFEVLGGGPSIADRIKDRLGRQRPPPAIRHLPTPYPHIVLRKDAYLWTSVHVALIKPGG